MFSYVVENVTSAAFIDGFVVGNVNAVSVKDGFARVGAARAAACISGAGCALAFREGFRVLSIGERAAALNRDGCWIRNIAYERLEVGAARTEVMLMPPAKRSAELK